MTSIVPVCSTRLNEASDLDTTGSADGSSGLSGNTSKTYLPTISTRRVTVASRYASLAAMM